MTADATKQRKRKLPPLGMRIIKTGICVFFCLLLNYLFSPQVALISSLAAIVSMQATLANTLRTAIGRVGGTVLGGLAGMALLPMAEQINIEGLYVFIMPIGMIFVIYLCVALKIPSAVSICAYVYITVLIVPFDPNSSGNAYIQALIRIADTAVGVVIALLVNRFIAPPHQKPITSVPVSVDTYSSVYNKVKSKLSGNEELILFDTRLVNKDIAKSGPEISAHEPLDNEPVIDTVSIPVPTSFRSDQCIDTAFIGYDYSVSQMCLPQKDGYITLPFESFPVTVAWHVEQHTGIETYGLMHHHEDTPHPRARVLKRAGRTMTEKMRYIPPNAAH